MAQAVDLQSSKHLWFPRCWVVDRLSEITSKTVLMPGSLPFLAIQKIKQTNRKRKSDCSSSNTNYAIHNTKMLAFGCASSVAIDLIWTFTRCDNPAPMDGPWPTAQPRSHRELSDLQASEGSIVDDIQGRRWAAHNPVNTQESLLAAK